MVQTAEKVAKRYGIASERMDRYGAESQQKACAAHDAGRFDEEIEPITVTAGVADAVTGCAARRSAFPPTRACVPERPTSVASIRTVTPGGVITAGNASQFSDGAGACVVMHERLRRAAAG